MRDERQDEVRILREVAGIRSDLEKDRLVTRVQSLETQRTLVLQEGDLDKLRSQRSAARAAVAEAQARLQTLRTDRRQAAQDELGAAGAELAQVGELLVKLRRRLGMKSLSRPEAGAGMWSRMGLAAAWKAKEDQAGLDSEGRLVDTAVADALVAAVKGQPGTIATYKQEAKKKNQPLAFALSDITALASARYGYSAEDVLNTCQALYETHKLTSYPRTDCAYLPESQHADAPRVLEAVKHVNPELAGLVDAADPRIKSKTWDDSKITAHHGIVPTMQKGSKAGLSERERNIYELIVRAYLAQFYPLHEYMQTTVGVEIAGENFAASGKVVTRNGWRDVFEQADEEDAKEGDDENGAQTLPPMKQGDGVTCTEATRRDAKTKPPARFTEGTLIRAMENIHKFVSDPEHKKMLREGDGIGTSATRASIISELKRREFLETKGKQIVSTTLGRSVIDALPEVVRSPVLTALYERMLKGVELGTAALDAFITKQEAFIRDQVAKANSGAVSIAGGKEATPVSSLHKCMACGNGLSRRPAKRKGQFWWGCSNFPTCKQTYPDLKGRPDYSKGRNGPAE